MQPTTPPLSPIHPLNPARLANTLRGAARQYAPAWAAELDAAWTQGGAQNLGAFSVYAAGALVQQGVLVLAGDVPPSRYAESGVLFNDWAEQVLNLYNLLARPLFPSFTQVQAFYADSDWPPIIGIVGAATPVVAVLAGYVVPFAAAKHGHVPARVELVGVMELVLDALEAADLPAEQFRALRNDLADALRHLLEQPVQMFALTPQAAELGELVRENARPPAMTVASAPPAMPANLPIAPFPVPGAPTASTPLPPDLPSQPQAPVLQPVPVAEKKPPASRVGTRGGSRGNAATGGERSRPPLPTPPPDLNDAKK